MSALWQVLLALFLAVQTQAQPAQTFVLGGTRFTWVSGGGIDPKLLNKGRLDTTNTPGDAIDFDQRPGWITPLFFDGQENVASRVLTLGTIDSPNAGRGYGQQLEGTVNGDPTVAFERKPTLFETDVNARDIRIVMDFKVPVGVNRVRFYPRNTVVSTPGFPFQNDFMRGYELFINAQFPTSASPNVLVARDTENQQAVVDLAFNSQYVRVLTLRSLANVPFEIDEIEVYGNGYLQEGTYISDLIDLGDRATVGPVRWLEEAVGDSAFSRLDVRVRTGADDTPILYRRAESMPNASGGRTTTFTEVSPNAYYALERIERGPLIEDEESWSPWRPARSGELISAPSPRRYIQFQLDFSGGLFTTRAVNRLEFDFLQPPIADTLRAEVFPRLAEAEKPATFRYAVRLNSAGQIRGYDRLEVDTGIAAERIRDFLLDGAPFGVEVESISDEMFVLVFPLISADGSLLEFTFDLPIFRFGTTFSGRAFNRRAGSVPQALEPGNALRFGPDDDDDLAGLSVAIPRPQIGKLVGEIGIDARIFTPNGDGVNDRFEIFFNLLQLTRPAPVVFEMYDLAGRRLFTVFAEEHGIGPLERAWDGRLAGGGLAPPGTYIWLLRIQADAFEERHTGTLGLVY